MRPFLFCITIDIRGDIMRETKSDLSLLGKTKKHHGFGHISRLKKRLVEDKISKAEIVELLLSYVIKSKDVKPPSKELLKVANGKFKNLYKASTNYLTIPGIGKETSAFFKLLNEYVNAYGEEGFVHKTHSARNQVDIINYYKNVCGNKDREEVFLLFLDAKNKISGHKKTSEGTLTQSLLYPREVIKEAMSMGALSIVIIHNHPSGDPTPSQNDRKITRRLLFAAKEMDIILLDHLIIGTEGKGYYSFYEDGLIEKYREEYKLVLSQME